MRAIYEVDNMIFTSEITDIGMVDYNDIFNYIPKYKNLYKDNDYVCLRLSLHNNKFVYTLFIKIKEAYKKLNDAFNDGCVELRGFHSIFETDLEKFNKEFKPIHDFIYENQYSNIEDDEEFEKLKQMFYKLIHPDNRATVNIDRPLLNIVQLKGNMYAVYTTDYNSYTIRQYLFKKLGSKFVYEKVNQNYLHIPKYLLSIFYDLFNDD